MFLVRNRNPPTQWEERAVPLYPIHLVPSVEGFHFVSFPFGAEQHGYQPMRTAPRCESEPTPGVVPWNHILSYHDCWLVSQPITTWLVQRAIVAVVRTRESYYSKFLLVPHVLPIAKWCLRRMKQRK